MSTVLKTQAIETIFDHGVTKAELDDLLGAPETPEEYFAAIDQDAAYADLYFLYSARGNKQTAASFLAKIKNSRYRNNISLPSCLL